MSSLILPLLVLVSLGAAGLALAPSLTGSSRAEKRRKALQGDIQLHRRETRAVRSREERRKSIQQAVKAQNELLSEKKRFTLQQRLFQAGMKISARAFIRNSVICAALAFLICWALQVPVGFALVFAAAAGYLLPKFYLARRRKKFQAAFLDELPNAVEAIVRGVKAGLPLNDTIRLVAKEAKEPIRSEFARVLDQQAVGKTMGEAVLILYDRVPLPEVNFFIVVITVQQQAGGNLSEALGNLARVLRNRKKMKLKIKAMSSEAKASAGIIGALPFVVAGLVSIVSPAYLTPLFMTTIGQFWLGVAFVMLATGTFIMNRMVQFNY